MLKSSKIFLLIGVILSGGNYMFNNDGFKNEELILNIFNNTRIKDLSYHGFRLINTIFEYPTGNEKVHGELVKGFYKPDILLRYKKKEKFISIKSFKAKEVHQERIKTFILFLREQGISERTQKTILLYQYGDLTMNGTGEKRYSTEAFQEFLKERIKEANIELNNNKDFIKAFIERCVFMGVIEGAIAADYLYCGNEEEGVIASRQQILSYCTKKDLSYLQHLHVGPLLFRPRARYVKNNETYPEKRHEVVIYWPRLKDDLKYLVERY